MWRSTRLLFLVGWSEAIRSIGGPSMILHVAFTLSPSIPGRSAESWLSTTSEHFARRRWDLEFTFGLRGRTINPVLPCKPWEA
jgi:hypothetical protein